MVSMHLLEGLRSCVPHLVDQEVFELLKGLPTFITDIITYLCNRKRERVIDSAAFLVQEMHTHGCLRSLVESEFLPLREGLVYRPGRLFYTLHGALHKPCAMNGVELASTHLYE